MQVVQVVLVECRVLSALFAARALVLPLLVFELLASSPYKLFVYLKNKPISITYAFIAALFAPGVMRCTTSWYCCNVNERAFDGIPGGINTCAAGGKVGFLTT